MLIYRPYSKLKVIYRRNSNSKTSVNYQVKRRFSYTIPDDSLKCVNYKPRDHHPNYHKCPNFIKVLTRRNAKRVNPFVNPIKLSKNLVWSNCGLAFLTIKLFEIDDFWFLASIFIFIRLNRCYTSRDIPNILRSGTDFSSTPYLITTVLRHFAQ